jgi:hypothetical protein
VESGHRRMIAHGIGLIRGQRVLMIVKRRPTVVGFGGGVCCGIGIIRGG